MSLPLPARPLPYGAVLVLLALAAPVDAGALLVDPADWTGSRMTPDAGGVHGASGWRADQGGLKISWDISLSAGQYTYRYTLSAADGEPLVKEVSHFLLQVSDSFTEANILSGSSPTQGPKTFSPDDPGKSNPDLPGGLYGVKFDFGSAKPTYTLVTDRAPVWGSFYAKGGKVKDLGEVYAYNAGFTATGTRPDMNATNFTNWIPTPDTVGDNGAGASLAPVPPSFLLMGMGGLGLLGLRYRSRRFRKA